MSYFAILWREWVVFRKKIVSNSLAALVGPALYLVTFGWGLGEQVSVGGLSYTAFVIPGILAMNAMTGSFSYIATDVNLSRTWGKSFEATMISPVTSWGYAMAKLTAGALRGLYCTVLILLLSLLFQPDFVPGAYFVLVLLLSCGVFSALGVICGMLLNSHGDMAKVSSFVITPMTFLCGTFFPIDRFPGLLRWFFELLPLTQSVKGMRNGLGVPGGWIPAAVLALWLVVLIPVAAAVCRRTETGGA